MEKELQTQTLLFKDVICEGIVEWFGVAGCQLAVLKLSVVSSELTVDELGLYLIASWQAWNPIRPRELLKSGTEGTVVSK